MAPGRKYTDLSRYLHLPEIPKMNIKIESFGWKEKLSSGWRVVMVIMITKDQDDKILM